MSFKTQVTSTVAVANLPTEFMDSFVFLNNGAARVEAVNYYGDGVEVTYTVLSTGEQKVSRRLPGSAPITFTAWVEDWPGEPVAVTI